MHHKCGYFTSNGNKSQTVLKAAILCYDFFMDELITHLVNRRQVATPTELAQIIDALAEAPFAPNLLEVDKPLWGGFWQFDVISPGYRLPAVELALLRAVRLDGAWPEGTGVEQFLADLHTTALDPHAGVWTLPVAGEPCVVLAATGGQPLVTVVWYCAATGQLHAGYRAEIGRLNYAGMVEQRSPGFARQAAKKRSAPPDWLVSAVAQLEADEHSSLAARLDAEILRRRLGL